MKLRFKLLLYMPDPAVVEFLTSELILHRIEILEVDELHKIKDYVRKIAPQMLLVYLDDQAAAFERTVAIVNDLNRSEDLGLLLWLKEGMDANVCRQVLKGRPVFLHQANHSLEMLVHNILAIKDAEERIADQVSLNRIKDTYNHCLQILYQERNISEAFQKLINYYPKIMLLDYWAIFTLDTGLKKVELFFQSVPPTRRKSELFRSHFERICEKWAHNGKPFLKTASNDAETLMRLKAWGWPVFQLYFIPMRLKGQTVGGVIVGSSNGLDLSASELRFLNEMHGLISRRMLEDKLSELDSTEVRDFSERLISNRFDEGAILENACKELTRITGATSTYFWQYNKGFGFLFPKYFYTAVGEGFEEAPEKNMLFVNQETFLFRIISDGKVQLVRNLSSDDRFDETTRKVFAQFQYETILMHPLRIHNEITGAIILNKYDVSDQFSIIDVHKVEEIVKRTRLALEDAQHAKETNLKLRQLARIFELGNEITHDLRLEEILARVARNLRKTLGWNDIAIYIGDDLLKNFTIINRLGFDESLDNKWKISNEMTDEDFLYLLEACEQIGRGYFYRRRNAGEPKNGTHNEWLNRDLLIIPLRSRNKSLGYLVVHDPVDRLRPTHEKIIPLEYYANQAAVAVENSQLYDRLRASEERYRALAQTMSLSLVTCDTKAQISYVNPAFQTLLGHSETELLDSNLIELFAENYREKAAGLFAELLDSGSGGLSRVENIEFEMASRGEADIPVSVYGFSLHQQGKKTGFFLILNDLRMIKRLERMKSDFNSMIVHDLRSPMNVIQGFIELIRNKVVGEINIEQEELLDIAKENVKKVLSLVDNFLVAAKLDVGKFSIDPKLDEINSLIRRQVENHKVLMKNKKISLHMNLDKNLPLLYFDSLRIDQVLNNLLGNAMKFTPENGNIYVESILTKNGDGDNERFAACISIKDTGTGISPKQLERVFEKYEQADDNQHLNVRGTGLGLSICREIVTLHDGEIWAESEPQKGSTFFFTLPIEAELDKIVK